MPKILKENSYMLKLEFHEVRGFKQKLLHAVRTLGQWNDIIFSGTTQ